MERGCRDCLFWRMKNTEASAHDDAAGECRRFPPVPDAGYMAMAHSEGGDDHDEPHAYVFPVTDAVTWCGEWRQSGRLTTRY